jgi:hypothetical protein
MAHTRSSILEVYRDAYRPLLDGITREGFDGVDVVAVGGYDVLIHIPLGARDVLMGDNLRGALPADPGALAFLEPVLYSTGSLDAERAGPSELFDRDHLPELAAWIKTQVTIAESTDVLTA